MMLVLNEKQQEAVVELKSFLNNSSEKCTILKGPAGSGKSLSIQEVLKGRPGNIVLCAVAHAAKNVLKDYLPKGLDATVTTLASFLNMREVFEEDGSSSFKPSGNPSPAAENVDILVVDECSQIGPEMLQYILDVIPPSCKVIFIGDSCQLPPISDSLDEGEISPTFQFAGPELIKVMRFAEDSPIKEITQAFREEIEKGEKFSVRKNLLYRFPTDNWSINGGGYKHIDDSKHMLESLYKSFYGITSPTQCRVLAYTRNTVKYINETVRSRLFPGNTEHFIPGEQIILTANYYKPKLKQTRAGKNYIGSDLIASNGEMFLIKEVKQFDYSFIISTDPGPYQNQEFNLPVYSLKCINASGKTVTLLTVDPDMDTIYKSTLSKIREECKKTRSWGPYMRYRDCVAKVSRGYASTCHSAQGSSIDEIYILEKDIVGENLLADKRKNVNILRMMYVALSRARKTIHIVNLK